MNLIITATTHIRVYVCLIKFVVGWPGCAWILRYVQTCDMPAMTHPPLPACFSCGQAVSQDQSLHTFPQGLEAALGSRLDKDVAESLMAMVEPQYAVKSINKAAAQWCVSPKCQF